MLVELETWNLNLKSPQLDSPLSKFNLHQTRFSNRLQPSRTKGLYLVLVLVFVVVIVIVTDTLSVFLRGFGPLHLLRL